MYGIAHGLVETTQGYQPRPCFRFLLLFLCYIVADIVSSADNAVRSPPSPSSPAYRDLARTVSRVRILVDLLGCSVEVVQCDQS
ncbi:hypothetical protein Trydic_g17783 [Trypoxylus dichotomus]